MSRNYPAAVILIALIVFSESCTMSISHDHELVAKLKAEASDADKKFAELFQKFMEQYNRSYAGEEELKKRFATFRGTVKQILDSGVLSEVKADDLTEFFDKAPEEAHTDCGFGAPLSHP